MPDYKTMYQKLFRSVTEAIEILQQAQLETEEIFIDSSEIDEERALKFKILDKKQEKT